MFYYNSITYTCYKNCALWGNHLIKVTALTVQTANGYFTVQTKVRVPWRV